MDTKANFFNPDFFVSGFPFDVLSGLKSDQDIVRSYDPVSGEDFSFALTYSALQGISTDYRKFSSEMKTILIDTPEGDELVRQRNFLLNMDPPRHKRIRDIVSRAFTMRRIDGHRPMVEEVVNKVFNQLPDSGEVEVVGMISTPIALEVICRIMGVDANDMEFINTNTNSMVYGDDPEFRGDSENGKYAATQLFIYAMRLYQNRESVKEGTLLHILCDSLSGGQEISQEEFCFFFMFLLAAGYETTRSMISNMLSAIAGHADEVDSFRRSNGSIERAVEEFLRFDPPVFQMCRTATQDVVVGGCPVSAGEKIGMMYHAANRDAAVFDLPDKLNLARDNAEKHLSFGIGRHHCLGAGLARMEMQIVLSRFLNSYKDIKILEKKRVRSNFINSIKYMKVRLA